MKKVLVLSSTLLLVLALFVFLNMEVTTGQGIDFKNSRLKLPLYLKVLNFYDRHFNKKWLTKRITGHLETKDEKIFRLFQWTYETIRPQPKNIPVFDDHVWSVYIRRYGGSENFNDLFTTLCNYIGTNATLIRVYNKETRKRITLSAVLSQRGWVIFDPWKGVYFNNNKGHWATIEEIKKENWRLEKLGETDILDSYYKSFFENLTNIQENELHRANIQSPINRIKYQLSKWFLDERPLFE